MVETQDDAQLESAGQKWTSPKGINPNLPQDEENSYDALASRVNNPQEKSLLT